MVFRMIPVLAFLLSLLPTTAFAAEVWHDSRAVNDFLKKFSRNKRTEVQVIGHSAAGSEMKLLTIHPAQGDDAPGVLVLGNPDGTAPLGTEAALRLIGEILGAEADVDGDPRWYILPVAHPDAAAAFSATPRVMNGLNATPVDEDRDGAQGEDPCDDLNGDGLITSLLVADPTGGWIIDADGVAVEADPTRRETGAYHLESEGRDDDGDGRRNEDGPGGVNPARNYPHRFEHWTDVGGLWAADQPETQAVLEFAHAHPDIGLILVLGRVNNLREVPAADEPGADGLYPAPERWAEDWSLKPGETRTLAQYRGIIREAFGRTTLRDHEILRYLEEDAAEAVDPADHVWWQAIAREYREFLEAEGPSPERLPSASSGPGSPEEWGYYQFGVPTFALDFWSLPCPAAADSTTGGEAADQQEDEDRHGPSLRALLAFEQEVVAPREDLRDWRGYLPWEETDEGLVGGMVPQALTTPPAALVDSLLRAPVRYLTRLPAWLPRLAWAGHELEDRGAGVFALTARLANNGPLPYPTAQGVRTGRVPPVVVKLEGAQVLDGRPRLTVERIGGRAQTQLRWLLRADPDAKITLTASAPSLGTVRQVVLTRGGGR